MLLVALLAGCATSLQRVTDEADCDPRVLAAGEVRARRIPCNDELMAGGEAARGDLLLENSRLRAFFKSDHALTRHGAAGGTLIDLAPPEERDGLVEIVPELDGAWLAMADLELWEAGDVVGLDVTGTLPDGTQRTVSWSLAADSVAVEIEGADDLVLVPIADTSRVGDVLESRSALSGGAGLLYATDAPATDLGGWIRFEGATRVIAGDRRFVVAEKWPDRVAVSGTTDGSVVHVRGEDGTLTRLPVVDGRFRGEVPAAAVGLVAARSGHADSETVPPGEDLELPVGAPGFLIVRVEDPDGRPIPSTVWWGGQEWWNGTVGSRLGTRPGTADLTVYAGPQWSVATLPDVTVADTVEIGVVLEMAHADAALADLAVPAWPDRGTRRSANRQLSAAASRGVRFAVTVADDEIPDAGASSEAARFLTAEAAARAPTASVGQPWSWPWARTSRRPAHGAPDTRGRDALDVMALLDGGEDRFTVADVGWLATAGPVFAWAPAPRGLRVDGLEDLPVLAEALDAGAALTVVGPLTWLGGVDPLGASTEASERALWTGDTVAGNGPWIDLDVLGRGPGERVDAPWLPVTVTCSGPDWMPLAGAALYGDGGVELARWDADAVTAPEVVGEAFVPAQSWLVATCWGEAAPPLLDEPAWAMTSPLWGARP